MTIPAFHSMLQPDALARVVADDYDLGGPVSCAIWHRGFNDYYDVDSPSGRFVFRIYPRQKYWMPRESDVRFELDLLKHLHGAGVSVVPPVPRRDGDVMGVIKAPEGDRYAALFAFAPGSPKEPTNDDLRTLGSVCAHVHEVSSGFVTEHHRYRLDADLLLEMPLREITVFLNGSRDADITSLRELVDRVRRQIETIPAREPSFGVIHADLHAGNCFWTDDGPTILDFDHCGYGWRVYDFVAAFGSDAKDKRDAFVQGYREVREITQAELDLLPAFNMARFIWDHGDILAMANHLGVRARLNDTFWDKYFERVRKMLDGDSAYD